MLLAQLARQGGDHWQRRARLCRVDQLRRPLRGARALSALSA